MSAAAKARLRVAVLLLVTFFIQSTFGNDLRIAGVAPDFITLVVVCSGLVGGAELGTVVGFFGGLLADLFLIDTPFGLSALALCLIGFAVGSLRSAVLREGWVLTPAVAFVGTAAAVALFLGLADLVGQSQLLAQGRPWLVRVALIEALDAAVLSLPVTRLVRWAAAGSTGVTRLAS